MKVRAGKEGVRRLIEQGVMKTWMNQGTLFASYRFCKVGKTSENTHAISTAKASPTMLMLVLKQKLLLNTQSYHNHFLQKLLQAPLASIRLVALRSLHKSIVSGIAVRGLGPECSSRHP